ncbi:M4 family metallopeptidase [Rhizocola hellebori]|uniref:M4 family metallopeptidase n=1 Tax=Rhizocola hellebori TaxID=1392758 RepID=UPI001942836E|nr:M4 family metallopeptidase [Rhizocola hellebori]
MEAARSHANQLANMFGVRDAAKELGVSGETQLSDAKVVHFAQSINGVPVIGGELNVLVDGAGNLRSINGETSAAALSGKATVTARAAADTAIKATAKATRLPEQALKAGNPVLSGYDPELIGGPGSAATVWKVEVTAGKGMDVRQLVLVNAEDGRVVLSFSQVAHADRRICGFDNVANPDNRCPGGVPVTRSEGQEPTGNTTVDAAYEFSGAYNIMLATLGRNSIDNNGMALASAVDFCPQAPCPYANAFWDGAQTTYGQGFLTEDVLAHEFTHGVTEFTSKLLYYYQSGAINESISDVIGEAFDQLYTGPFAGNDDPSVKWLMGEDVAGGAARNMANPPAFNQPDATSSPLWKADPFDMGGVHINSGVGNKAAYLMTEGGSFGGFVIVPIGDILKVARIWLAAEGLLTAGSDYTDLAFALHQACINLTKTPSFGITDNNCLSVLYSTGAVGMSNVPTAEGTIPQASQCTPGTASTNVLFENFNWPVSATLPPGWSETGEASIDGQARPSNSAGNALFIPDPFIDPLAIETVERTSFVQLPVSSSLFAYFNHHYSFDFVPAGLQGQGYFDGGRVEVDVEGDAFSWIPLNTGWNVGPDKALSGKSGVWFSGDSRGWTSSRVSLAAYSGKRVKLRFVLATDGFASFTAAYGWWIDNFKIYSCAGKKPLTTDINGDGYGDVVIGEPGRRVSDLANGGDVRMVWGNSQGLDITGNEVFSQDNALVAGAANTNGRFGTAVATADFHGDGFADIAVGAPNSPEGEGSVTLLRGYVWGVTTQNSFFAAPASTSVPEPFANSNFGASLAVGDFNDDGFGDLAIGAPGHNAGRGGVKVLYGSASGLVRTTGATNWFVQGANSVPGTAEDLDGFGSSLASGDFNGDGRTDLAIGAAGEDVGTAVDAGSVTVLLGTASGLSGTGAQEFTEGAAGMPGTAESGDQFGFSLAAGDVTGDLKADLVVGAPGETVGGNANSGAIFLLRGSASGPTTVNSQAIDESSTIVPGEASTSRFGYSVAVGDQDGDGRAEVVAGAPNKNVGGQDQAGAVTILPGSVSGLVGVGTTWSQGTNGVPDTAEANDHFGAAVLMARIRFQSRSDLVAGAPDETATFAEQGLVHFLTNTSTGNQTVSSSNLIGGGMAIADFGAALG